MKWIFLKKNEECYIKINENGEKKDFSYIEMIKRLYEKEKLEEPEYEGDFSEGEIESVNQLIKDINILVDEFWDKKEFVIEDN